MKLDPERAIMKQTTIDNLSVAVSYKGKNGKENIHVYDFKQYTEIIKMELLRIILDVEDAFIYMQNGIPKEDWPEELNTRFQKIRHKLLDEANAVYRIPENLNFKE